MPAQDQWAEHAAFMNGLVDAGLILLGGPTVRILDERWERTTPRLTDGLEDPRQRGLSPVPTCSHSREESRYKAAATSPLVTKWQVTFWATCGIVIRHRSTGGDSAPLPRA